MKMSSKLCTRWAFDLNTWTPTLTQLAQAVSVVQPEERVRLLKFHFIDDFLSSLVGRLLMRRYVSLSTGLVYDSIAFSRDVRGKPYWLRDEAKDTRHLSFNVSHQGSFVVLCGIYKCSAEIVDFGVGVDVMKLEYSGGKDLHHFFHIMHNKFSDTEWRCIKQSRNNRHDQIKAFMRHWCLKEAYVKELGVGITIDLQKISFGLDNGVELTYDNSPLTGTTLKLDGVPMHNWYFEEHMLSADYCAAIAFRNCRPEAGKFELLETSQLLKSFLVVSVDDEIMEYCRNVLKKPRK